MFKTSKSRIYLAFGLNFSSDNYYKLHVLCVRHCNSSVCFRVYYINYVILIVFVLGKKILEITCTHISHII